MKINVEKEDVVCRGRVFGFMVYGLLELKKRRRGRGVLEVV